MDAARALLGAGLSIALAGAAGCGGAPPAPPVDAGVPPVTAKPAATAATAAAPANPPPIALPPPEDPAPAVAACRAGDAEGCARAARLYFDGWGVPRDMIRVAVFGGLACSAGIGDVCALRDLAYFWDSAHALPAGLAAYRRYLAGFDAEGGPAIFCTELPSRDRWGWAAYHVSDCHGAEAAASAAEPRVAAGLERRTAAAACIEQGDKEACLGVAMTSNPDPAEHRSFAPPCRSRGLACDIATGATRAETAQFRAKACLGKSYAACNDWGLALQHSQKSEKAQEIGQPRDPRVGERIHAEVCLHPEKNQVPVSAGEARDDLHPMYADCGADSFPSLAASADAGDQALVRALSRVPEEIGAADCTGRLYDARACALFVLGEDEARLGPRARRTAEAARWTERMASLDRICGAPPPFATDRDEVARLCGRRDRLTKEHQAFLAGRGRTP